VTLKAHISSNVPPSKVRSRIPAEFHGLVIDTLLRASSYTVISFRGMSNYSTFIVDSKSLAKALSKSRPAGDHLVVVAHGFTAEAREILGDLGALSFFTSDSYWSDESWAGIRDNR
jgi:hypothetical protein